MHPTKEKIMINQGYYDSFISQLSLLPVMCSIIFGATCVAPFFTSLLIGRKYPLMIPTVSESAREYPGSRIFSLGSTYAGNILWACAWIITDVPAMNGFPLPFAVKIMPFLVVLFFVIVSGCGLDDNVYIHLTFAIVAFFTVVVFSLFVYIVYRRLNILVMKRTKSMLLLLGGISLAVLAVTWGIGNEDPIGSVKSLSEFSFLFIFAVYVMLWTADLKDYSLMIVVDWSATPRKLRPED